ncbi:ComGF family competence protein [Virgibacillus sp. C22-A2]|uniref:ComGF family competence protein n=2 Tax=Virgibacillus tibetensis TaxID=3042313 RepID=A0ABU6KAA3_9BACI|nr:ComGF family competence protein [Virgibacillus sp. C22-A2]
MKKYVYTPFYQNNRGFTFISTLLLIIILALTLPFAGYLLKASSYTVNPDEISIQLFFQFLRNDMINATDYQVSSSSLSLNLDNGNTATIGSYNNQIRRQVNGLGHEVYLQNVKEWNLIPLSYGFHATITSLEGEIYEKTIVFYK